MRTRALVSGGRSLLLVLALLAGGCGGEEDVPGGAADLPGPVPEGVAFAEPPAGALAAPPFSVKLLDGTPVTGAQLWSKRPVVLVFTSSWCSRCADCTDRRPPRWTPTAARSRCSGSSRRTTPGRRSTTRRSSASGIPSPRRRTRVWLDYAAREPPVIVLVSRGGKVLRGWPGGVPQAVLARRLGEPSGEGRAGRDRSPARRRLRRRRAARMCASGSSSQDKNVREEGIECAGARPYHYVHARAPYTIEDGDGEVVADGELPAGHAENAEPEIDWNVPRIPTFCVMEFEVELPERPRYRLRLERGAPLEFVAADEPVVLLLG